MESAMAFPGTLRASYRGTKMFLKPHARSASQPSLRSRALAALNMSKVGSSTLPTDGQSTPNVDESSTATWLLRFRTAVTEFHELASSLGLSAMDREYIDQHLVHDVPLGKLPVLEFVNDRLRRIFVLSNAISATISKRSKALDRLRRTCAFGGRAVCSSHMHEKLSLLLQEVDELTIEAMKLIVQWREYFQFPMPFFQGTGGENVLLCFCDQYAVGSPMSLANGHLRTTSRYSPFFYASPFDAVASGKTAPSFKEAVSLWNTLVMNELQRQRESVHEQLAFARMGLYHCVLRLPRDVLHTAGMKPGLLVHINDRNRKRLLVSCLASAYGMLLRMRSRTGGSLANVAGLATFSTKALHLQYFRRWIEWVSARRERREAAESIGAHVRHQLAKSRFDTWMAKVVLERERASRWKPFLLKTQMHLLRVYTQRWFMFHSVGNIARSVRRALFLQYFHRFHFLVLSKRLAVNFSAEVYRDRGGRYPRRLPTLGMVVGLKNKDQTPALASLEVVRRHQVALWHVECDHYSSCHLDVILVSQVAWAVLLSDALLERFQLAASTELAAARVATTAPRL